MITATRFHDISCGHRVSGHENKCRHLHGHNYRIHFTIVMPIKETDHIGRVMDFSVIKEKLCHWLEENYDHKFLIWEHDEMAESLRQISPDSVVIVPYNPTAENMAKYICEVVAIEQLAGTGCVLKECIVEETRKCKATYTI